MKFKIAVAVVFCVFCQPALASFVYVYTGNPFAGPREDQANLLPGSTNVTITFTSDDLLVPSTVYNYSDQSPIFGSMLLSDGRESIYPGAGTFMSSSFIETDAAGKITKWVVAELQGAGRLPFGTCCSVQHVPVIYSYNSNGSTDATIQDDGFFGFGPNANYAYNNRAPGVWNLAGVSPVPGPVVGAGLPGVCTENLIRVDDVMESPKLAG
jgi:hypothetical protein